MASVFYLSVTANDAEPEPGDTNIVTQGVFTSQKECEKALAKWCRKQWKQQHPKEKPLPTDDKKAIKAYFDFWTPEEAYNIDRMTLDKALS